ncbi:hypothetical protein OAT71_01835 [Flavobacteriales bacterium]|nr:hypothetical protein [Flavobacteriales bacterium]
MIFDTLRSITLTFLRIKPKAKQTRTSSEDINIDRDKSLAEVNENGFSSTFKISQERINKLIA